jgi:predicted oxidoreductase
MTTHDIDMTHKVDRDRRLVESLRRGEPMAAEDLLRVARLPTGLWLDPTGARLLLMADATSPRSKS